MGGVFLNYRVRDSALLCAAVRDTLVRRFGPDQVFRDCDSLQAGDRYPDGLRAALEDADVLVSIIGPSWSRLTDESGVRLIDRPHDWVRYEIARALERGIPILPVLLSVPLEHIVPPTTDDLPADIRELALRQSLPVGQDRFGADLDVLIDRLIAVAPTLVIPRLFAQPPPPRSAEAAPSTLLRAEYAVVPFTGRTEQLADLRAWATDSAACSVRLLAGAAGAGKTRLAETLCAELRTRGWLAGVVHGQAPAGEIRNTAGIDKPLLVVVDDVETRIDQLISLATAVADRALLREAPARLLLLARSAGDWLHPLRQHADPAVRALLTTVTADSTVTVALTESERHPQFELARAAFAVALGRPDPGGAMPDAARGVGSLLEVHAAALGEVLDATGSATSVRPGTPPLARLTRFDRIHLRRTARAAGEHIDPAYLAELGTLATLCQPGSPAEADALRDRLPDLLGQPLRADHLDRLRLLYPGPYVINAIRPDVLAEQWVAATLAIRPELATAVATHGTTEQTTNAMTVLGRTLERHPNAARSVVDIIGVAPSRLAPLAIDVAGRLGEPEPFIRALSTAIDGVTFGVEDIRILMERVQSTGMSNNPVRAAVLKQFVTTFTAPINRTSGTQPSGSTNNGLVRFVSDMVFGTLDPTRAKQPTTKNGEDIVPREMINSLLRYMINGKGHT